MKKNIQVNDDVLVKYLLAEASPEERAAVQAWVGKEENARYFEHFRLIWEESQQLAPRVMISEDAAWQRLRNRVRGAQPAPLQATRVVPLHKIYRIAAAVIGLVVVSSAAWWMLGSQPRQIALRSGNDTLRDTLPDGTVITLNKNSEARYKPAFAGSTREITLEGEAFFEVAQDAQKPFIIHSGDVAVRILGTSLNVKTTQRATEVIVETGRVEVAKETHRVELAAHEMATVTASEAAPVKTSSTDQLYRYYSDHSFVCDNTPLYKLVDALNDAYNVHIQIANPGLRNLPLTSTFHAAPLDTVLGIVGESLNIKVTKQGKEIVLE